MKGAQHARDRKTATSLPAGHHRPGGHGGDRSRRVPGGQPGGGGERRQHAPGQRLWRGLSISKQYFGSTVEPYTGKETPTYRYTLSNANGMRIQLLTFGGITQAINVPGANGQVADVMLGFKTLQDYVT